MASELNEPGLWQARLPRPPEGGNKYDRGYVAVFAAPELTGATRLASISCSRSGAGLVSVVADQRADIYRTCLDPDIMVVSRRPPKSNVLLGGSGGISRAHLDELLNTDGMLARVFDADALPQPSTFNHLDENCILTPHRGEFERNFAPVGEDVETAALTAARDSGAIVVLKGPETIIASPHGHSVRNTHASPYLAKAGTGDALAGMIAGLAAQNMPLFQACCAAVWMHGEAGRRIGPGLVAGDISDRMPEILRDLLS